MWVVLIIIGLFNVVDCDIFNWYDCTPIIHYLTMQFLQPFYIIVGFYYCTPCLMRSFKPHMNTCSCAVSIPSIFCNNTALNTCI